MDVTTPSISKCPHCGLERKNPRTLAEHIYTSHDGPVPEHWLEAEARAEANE